MDLNNATRQVEELLALKEKWYNDAITILTPTLFSRLETTIQQRQRQQHLDVKKCLKFELKCSVLYPDELSDLILEFTFPFDYPSNSTCLVHSKSRNDNSEYKSCTSAIEEYIRPFTGCECVELIIDWLAENKDTCLSNSHSSLTNDNIQNSNNGLLKCFVLRYNHLLFGPEHKKEKEMMDTAKKFQLQGCLVWGTPGIVILVPPSTEEDAKDYASECRNIGKRPGGIDEIFVTTEFIETLGIGKGKFQDIDISALKSACNGNDDLLLDILGVR